MEIKGVEIFSVGKWNGDEYTMDDLRELVDAFNENSVGVPPYLKLGHDGSQELLQKDGYPAAGWVERLYIQGQKLVADFSGIPEKIYKLIEKQAYRKVSSEIFFNIEIGGKVYKRMLAAVALLGADNPGVMNLNDIMAMYKKFEGKFDKVLIENEIDFIMESKLPNKGGNVSKTENEIKLEFELQQKAEALEKANAKIEASNTSQKENEKELADLKEFKIKAEKEKSELLIEAQKAKIEKFTSELVADKLCTPGMKPLIEELLGADKKEYSVKIENEEKKMTKEEVLKEALRLFAAAKEVNFAENSSTGDAGSKDKQAQLDKEAKAMAADKKIPYGQALKAVMKNQK